MGMFVIPRPGYRWYGISAKANWCEPDESKEDNDQMDVEDAKKGRGGPRVQCSAAANPERGLETLRAVQEIEG